MTDLNKLKYTETHEWAKLDGKLLTVGITDHAQKEISDVVFVDLPKAGASAAAKQGVMVIESVKAAFDIYAPMSGKIVKVNDKLKDSPELVNKSPYEDGWLFQIECSNAAEWEKLLSKDQYENVKSQSHH
jgi:glycine cleavage system H protein